jgi:hypothetical protein
MNPISNCFLCNEKGLHVMGEGESLYQQCINCGYSTTSKFIGNKKDNENYKKLNDEMKSWVREANGNIWIPSMITLPFGMLYPIDAEEVVGDGTRTVMKWAIANMVEIPEEDREKYPTVDGTGFYEKRFDTDNPSIFDEFIFAMSELNDRAKDESVDAKE